MKIKIVYRPRYVQADFETRLVEVVRRFTITLGNKEYLMFVHRVIDNPNFFASSDWISGTRFGGGDYDTPELAEAGGRRRLASMLKMNTEAEIISMIETRHFDDALNDLPVEEEDEL